MTPSPQKKSLITSFFVKRELAIGHFGFKKLCHTFWQIFAQKKICMQEAQLFSPPLYCIAFPQLYSWKLFEFEFFNMMGQWNVVITKEGKSCVQFITFQNPAHKALTLPWKCNLKFPCSSPIGQCHDVNEDWHQVFQFSTQHNWISKSLEPLLHLL
jgi:hypothetical protein